MITWRRELSVIILSLGFDNVEQERMWGKVNCYVKTAEELEGTYDSSRVTVSCKKWSVTSILSEDVLEHTD